MSDLALTLAAVPDSVPTARHTMDRLAPRLDEPRLEDLRLLVSEVVANSVRHGEGAGPIELRVTIGPANVHVEVEDPGPGFRPVDDGSLVARTHGWGLVLVERLAARWGVVAGATTTVWFELDLAAA